MYNFTTVQVVPKRGSFCDLPLHGPNNRRCQRSRLWGLVRPGFRGRELIDPRNSEHPMERCNHAQQLGPSVSSRRGRPRAAQSLLVRVSDGPCLCGILYVLCCVMHMCIRYVLAALAAALWEWLTLRGATLSQPVCLFCLSAIMNSELSELWSEYRATTRSSSAGTHHIKRIKVLTTGTLCT